MTQLSEIGIDSYLRLTADATARRLAPPLPPSLRTGVLMQTIEAFAICDLNVKACARHLNVHANTVYHRLNRINALTGRNPRTFRGLSELTTAMAMNRGENIRGHR